MRSFLTISILTVCIGLGLFCSDNNIIDPGLHNDVENWKLPITGLQVKYLPDSNTIRLNWNAPLWTASVPLDSMFFKVYRTTALTADSQPDTSAMSSTEQRSFVAITATTFYDVLDLENLSYYYGIRAQRIVSRVNGGLDTVEGELSNISSTKAGGNISFSIGGGDIFTATDKSNLKLVDWKRRIKSVRFTQKTFELLKKANGSSIVVNFDDPANPPDSQTISSLIASKLIDANGKLMDSVSYTRRVPQFDANDPANITSYQLSDTTTIKPWTLSQGNGEKWVFAELTYNDTNAIDTLSDYIKIQPYRVKVTYRNKMGESTDATMRIKEVNSNPAGYVIYKPFIDFSLVTFSDSTFDTDFNYWIVIPDSTHNQLFDQSGKEIILKANNAPWIETKPRAASLTGIGSIHDYQNVYHYSLDTLSPDGKENLSALRITTQSPDDLGAHAFRLIGEEAINENCVTGSYFGENPLIYNSLVGFSAVQTKNTGSSSIDNFNRIKAIINKGLAPAQYATKLFMVVIRMKGRFFNDTRTIITRRDMAGRLVEAQKTYFDWYQPTMANITKDEIKKSRSWLGNDSLITSIFDYTLIPDKSIFDVGLANIKAIDLIIAQKPDTMEWDKATTPLRLTENQLLGFRHVLLPYPIRAKQSSFSNVIWENINPMEWPSGDYIMAVVTEDQYGNRGFAPVSSETSNPFRVFIQTGK